jgi:anaerobic selenocysteine-containing dehydrogenase
VRATRALAHPDLGAAVADIDAADAVLVLETDPLEEAPILDLRVRKAVRRSGARLVVASSAPTALDGGASELLRFAPGGAEALLRALQKALVESRDGEAANGSADDAAMPVGHAALAEFLAANRIEGLAERAGVETQDVTDVAALLTGADKLVVIWGERLGWGETGPGAVDALLDLALVLGLDAAEGSGTLEIPAAANGRGLREVGCLPGLGPGFSNVHPPTESDAAKSFYLLHCDPLRELPGRPEWEAELAAAPFVVAHSQFVTESLEQHADVVFPAEAYAEKEGTLTHPDGRLQRLRPSIGRPGSVRMEWQVLVDLAGRVGLEGLGADKRLPVTAGAVFDELADQVFFSRPDPRRHRRGRRALGRARGPGRRGSPGVQPARILDAGRAFLPAGAGERHPAPRRAAGALGLVGRRPLAVAAVRDRKAGGRAEPARRRAAGVEDRRRGGRAGRRGVRHRHRACAPRSRAPHRRGAARHEGGQRELAHGRGPGAGRGRFRRRA